jgi:hypothetical protein
MTESLIRGKVFRFFWVPFSHWSSAFDLPQNTSELLLNACKKCDEFVNELISTKKRSQEVFALLAEAIFELYEVCIKVDVNKSKNAQDLCAHWFRENYENFKNRKNLFLQVSLMDFF